MKRAIALLLLAGCSSTAAPSAPAGPAPDAALTTLDGAPVRMASLWQGKPVLLVFMTSWCLTCRAEVPEVTEFSKAHAVAAICTGDRPEAARRFRAQTGAGYPFYLDAGEAAAAYGVQSSPTCILVDEGGRIRYRGAHPPGKGS